MLVEVFSVRGASATASGPAVELGSFARARLCALLGHECTLTSDLPCGLPLISGPPAAPDVALGSGRRIASNTTNISRESSVGTISYMAPEATRAATRRGNARFACHKLSGGELPI